MTTQYDADFREAEQLHNLPAGILKRVAQVESNFDPAAVNPDSGAAGLMQFMPATAEEYGVNPMDARSAIFGAAELMANNRTAMQQKIGRDPTDDELYMGHLQGATGASRIINNPESRLGDQVTQQAAELNAGSPDMRAGDYSDYWRNRFSGDEESTPRGFQPTSENLGAAVAAQRLYQDQLMSDMAPALVDPNRSAPRPTAPATLGEVFGRGVALGGVQMQTDYALFESLVRNFEGDT